MKSITAKNTTTGNAENKANITISLSGFMVSDNPNMTIQISGLFSNGATETLPVIKVVDDNNKEVKNITVTIQPTTSNKEVKNDISTGIPVADTIIKTPVKRVVEDLAKTPESDLRKRFDCLNWKSYMDDL